MTEPTCRHCGMKRADHHGRGGWSGPPDFCVPPDEHDPHRRFTPGPTYAVLQDRLRVAREALEQVLAVSADRARFVAMGPRGFAKAEQIARAALTETEETDG